MIVLNLFGKTEIMKAGKLLLLAGAVLAANQLLKTEKGKKLKKDVSDAAGKWKEKVTDMMNRERNEMSDSHPSGSSASEGPNAPMW
mgnify:CR=1 FL=1